MQVCRVGPDGGVGAVQSVRGFDSLATHVKLKELPDGWPVAVDTETSGLRVDDGARLSIVSFAFRHPATNAMVARAIPFDQGTHALPLGPKDIPLRHAKRMAKWEQHHQDEVAPNLPPDRYPELIWELTRFRLIYHNRKFDETHLATGPRAPHRFHDNYPRVWEWLATAFEWDTAIAQNVIEPKYPLGLKPTAVRLELTDGGEDESAKALKPFLGPKTDPRYDLVPWSVIGPYATEDPILTLLLAEWQDAWLDDSNEQALYYIQKDFAECTTLINMERRGLGWDVPLATHMSELLKARQKEVAESLPFRVTPPGAKKFFFTDANRRPYSGKITDGGQPQLDSEVQEMLIRDGVEYAEEYRFHEKLKSALSKWYVGWTEKAGADGRLRCDYDQVGVATGRLGGRHINLVAIPHNDLMPDVPGLVPVRRIIHPKPGHALWEVDMAQAEVRVGAVVAECLGLLQGFRAGVDAHSQMSTLIFGDAEPRHRRIAKTLNLAIQYGAGLRKIKAQLEKDTGEKWTLAETKRIRDAWHEAAPEMSMAIDLATHEVETLGYVRLWNGRFRWFEHYRGGPPDPAFTGFNGKCQGGVAEVMKLVMVEVDNRFPETVVNQVHDSLMLELPEEDETTPYIVADMMKRRFEQCMQKTWKKLNKLVVMPFEADVKKWEY